MGAVFLGLDNICHSSTVAAALQRLQRGLLAERRGRL